MRLSIWLRYDLIKFVGSCEYALDRESANLEGRLSSWSSKINSTFSIFHLVYDITGSEAAHPELLNIYRLAGLES